MVLCALAACALAQTTFRFSNTHGNHMVRELRESRCSSNPQHCMLSHRSCSSARARLTCGVSGPLVLR